MTDLAIKSFMTLLVVMDPVVGLFNSNRNALSAAGSLVSIILLTMRMELSIDSSETAISSPVTPISFNRTFLNQINPAFIGVISNQTPVNHSDDHHKNNKPATARHQIQLHTIISNGTKNQGPLRDKPFRPVPETGS